MQLRKGLPEDIPALQKLFVDTIINVCADDYSEQQRQVWSSSPNTERWNNLIEHQLVLLAEIDDTIVGFASLRDDNYLDMFYVHADYQRQGIAKMLYQAIETKARNTPHQIITTDASITAAPFFTKMGFESIQKQTVQRQGVSLENYRMQKLL